MSSGNRFDELIPCQNEVREDEQDGSKCEDAASLEHCTHQHCADKQGIDADTDLHYSRWHLRDDSGECHHKQCYCAEYDGCKVSFGPSCELAVFFYSLEISVDEIDDEPDMAQGEESHLSHKVVA